MDDVDGIARAEGLGQDVLDARGLHDCTDRPTRDDAGSRCGRLEQDDSSSVLADDLVRDGRVHERDHEHVLLGFLHALLDGGRYLLRLAVADADPAGSVTHHDERGEAEPAAALDHLSHAVDGNHSFLEGAPLRLLVVPSQISNPPSRAPSATALTLP